MPKGGARVGVSPRARVMRNENEGNGCDRSEDLARVGSLVRALRLECGLTMSALARRSAVAPSTISRLERGELRPRPSLLTVVASGLDPDRQRELREMLLAAAEGCLAPDTAGWQRYRWRRQELGWNTGEVPLPSDLARRVAAHKRAAEARRAAYAIVDRRGPLTDADLDEGLRLMEIAEQADKEAGRAIIIGDVRYGFM